MRDAIDARMCALDAVAELAGAICTTPTSPPEASHHILVKERTFGAQMQCREVSQALGDDLEVSPLYLGTDGHCETA